MDQGLLVPEFTKKRIFLLFVISWYLKNVEYRIKNFYENCKIVAETDGTSGFTCHRFNQLYGNLRYNNELIIFYRRYDNDD